MSLCTYSIAGVDVGVGLEEFQHLFQVPCPCRPQEAGASISLKRKYFVLQYKITNMLVIKKNHTLLEILFSL